MVSGNIYGFPRLFQWFGALCLSLAVSCGFDGCSLGSRAAQQGSSVLEPDDAQGPSGEEREEPGKVLWRGTWVGTRTVGERRRLNAFPPRFPLFFLHLLLPPPFFLLHILNSRYREES